jgi:uncharacterized membrane protein
MVILPIALAISVLIKFLEFVRGVVAPIAHLLPPQIRLDNLAALVLLLVASFAVGLFVSTSWGSRLVSWFEESIMSLIPGYRTMRMIIHSFLGRTDVSGWQPALIRLDETEQPGFVVERHADGQFTVFVPGAPVPTSGDVHIVDPERVRLVSARAGGVVRCLSRLGSGVEDFKRTVLPDAPPRKNA